MNCRKKAGNTIDKGRKDGAGVSADHPDMDHEMGQAITIQPNPGYMSAVIPPRTMTPLGFDDPSNLLAEMMMRYPSLYGNNAETALARAILDATECDWNESGGMNYDVYYVDEKPAMNYQPITQEAHTQRYRENLKKNGVEDDDQDIFSRRSNQRLEEENWFMHQPNRLLRVNDSSFAPINRVPDNVKDPWLLACYQMLGRVEAFGTPYQRRWATQIKDDLDKRILKKRAKSLQTQAQAIYDSNNCLAGVPFHSPEELVERAKTIREKDLNSGGRYGTTRLELLAEIFNGDPMQAGRYQWIDGQIVNLKEMIPGYYERMDEPDWVEANQYHRERLADKKETTAFLNKHRTQTPIFEIPSDAKPEWVRLAYEYVTLLEQQTVPDLSDDPRTKRQDDMMRRILKDPSYSSAATKEKFNQESKAEASRVRKEIEERFPKEYYQ